MDTARDVVMIGVDPHKRSITIEAGDAREVLRATGSFPDQHGRLPGAAAVLPAVADADVGRRGCRRSGAATGWAAARRGRAGAGCAGEAVGQGAGVRRRTRAQTDATDAHAVVMAALRDRAQLRELSITEELVVLRLLADRRDELSRSRAQGLNRLHRLMTELIPGGIPVKKSVPQYQTMLARVRPGDVVGRTVRRLAADQLADLVRLDTRLKTLKAELTEAVLATGSQLMDLHGIGPVRRRPHPGRRRRRPTLPRPQPLRVLDRHRPDRRLLRRPDPPPALPRR